MGWLGGSSMRGEPERLTNQIRPDALDLGAQAPARVNPAPAPVTQVIPVTPEPPEPVAHQAPDAAPTHCAAYVVQGPAGLAQATALAETTQGQVRLTHEVLEESTNWRVRIPPAPNQSAAEQRLKNLQGRNIQDVYLVRSEGPSQWSISLGLYSSESSARQRLASLREQGVSNAEVVPGTPTRHAIEFRGPAEALEDVAARIEASLGADARRACSQ